MKITILAVAALLAFVAWAATPTIAARHAMIAAALRPDHAPGGAFIAGAVLVTMIRRHRRHRHGRRFV